MCAAADVELVDSHVIPSWAYKRIRKQASSDPLLNNPNPVRMRGSTAVQLSNQIEEPMLCIDCEQRFGVQENWFKRVTEAEEHALPRLSDLLDPARPMIDHEHSLARAGRLDTDALAYFALSVFWRAHECSKSSDFSLEDRNADAIRLWLDGKAAPPSQISLTAYYCEQGYVDRHDLVSAFKTPASSGGLSVFVIACMVSVLYETRQPTDGHPCLLHSADKALVVAPLSMITGPLGARIATSEAKGALRRYGDARRSARNRSADR